MPVPHLYYSKVQLKAASKSQRSLRPPRRLVAHLVGVFQTRPPEFLDIDQRLAGPSVILRIGIAHIASRQLPHDTIRVASMRSLTWSRPAALS